MFVPKRQIEYKTLLAGIKHWRQTGDKPLHGPMMTDFIDAYTLAVNVMESPTRWLHGFIFRHDFEKIRDISYKSY